MLGNSNNCIKNDDDEIQILIKKNSQLNQELISEDKNTHNMLIDIEKLNKKVKKLKTKYNDELKLEKKYKLKLEKMLNSRSWRYSKIIRKVGSLYRRLKKNNLDQHQNSPNTQLRKELTSVVEIKDTNNGKPALIQNILQRENNGNILKQKFTVKELDSKLWGGFSQYALEELRQIKRSPDMSVEEKMRAARSLSRWYYDKNEIEKAYEELQYINDIKPLKKPNPDRVIPEIKLLKKLGKINIAKKRVWETIDARGLQPELCLGMAHLAETDAERLNWYNILYDKYGYQQIKKIDVSKPLDIENIYTENKGIEQEYSKYKVSVIIPAYNAGSLIHVALNSLLNQTVQNLEIIVVDDCSTDNTVEVVSRFAKKDNRIKLIKKEKNEGAYAARNTGLQYATGDFITIHDSDDWSHSQKIEVQLRELIENPRSVGTISYLVRALKDISPLNAGSQLSMKFMIMNTSSLLVRRDVITKIGGWDSVRVAGDSEFLWRIEKVFGKENVIRVEPSVPLSISLSNENSLTKTSTTHVKTIKFGLRRTYREAFEWWHSYVENVEDLFMDPKKINRHFPCPVPNMIRKPEFRKYNSILIADFSSQTDQDILKYFINDCISKGEKLAIFHWPDYEGDPNSRITSDIQALISRFGIDILVPNEEVETINVLFLTPKIYDYKLDSVPKIKSEKAFIVSNEDFPPESRLNKINNIEAVMKVRPKWRLLSVINY